MVAHARAVRELAAQAERLESWGERLGAGLLAGGRLLVAGNGGSAAQAQHLTGELVGRYLTERPALSAIALLTDAASLTAVANDYGWEDVFARQVRAHGRAGDVLLLLSTSGESTNLLQAAASARSLGLHVWSLTGPEPNSLAGASDESVAVSGSTAVVQEAHLVAIHLLCAAVDSAVSELTGVGGSAVGEGLDLAREAAAG
ncbi:MAG: phosphoheptose isomerase [Candidatus Nephthysia bennettiae]|nr:SIS domain-containing protein [Candidatus Dormibacteraeota bacterium]PZR88153.1 MAG: phosphoheptose isomerase [Candidatus Dormibacteraeota bacterium]